MSAKTLKRSGGGRKSGKKQRIIFLDYLRAFAPILVITIHVISRVQNYSDPFPDPCTPDFFWLAVLMRISRIAVPIFCMISGALFLDPRRPFDMKKHFTKTIPRVVFVYLVWSLIYAAAVAAAESGTPHDRLVIYVRESLVGYWHLWYFKMLIAAYLLVPLLRKITEKRSLARYAAGLIMFIVSMHTLTVLFETVVAVRGGNGLLGSLRTTVDASIVNIAGFMDLGFIAYFIIGYVLATEKFSKKWKWLIYGLGIAGLIMTIVFTVGRSRALGTDFALENDGLGDLGIFLFASAAFVWVREVIGNRKKVGRAVSFMAKHSLGIYVIHALPILLFSRFFEMPSYSMPSMFVIIPGSVLMIYGFSLLVSWLFSKIPLLNKVV